ncbi:uncharacterized protein LOC122274533 [Carya illinoinensis]|uniref:uncharacterized protein LOC122274533 n=1 Tax=Carya illinoinensis TaxID=32201 RepID=UPI001C71EC9C|nr:uncharacterized protein LOC122274533 [Carya illinoinensis]
MRLNPSKCAFEVQSGKFLGFIVSERGIEASPDKIEALINMRLPKNLNETQQLAGRVAALGSPSLLKRLEKGDVLYAYLAVSQQAVSAFLIKDEEAVRHPIYYVSRALRGAEAKYPRIELLAFALVVEARKLHPYFQAHAVKVLTEAPLAKILRKPDCTGRLIGWSIKLSEFDIEYEPRKAIKGQAMVDFVAEFLGFPQEEVIAPTGKPWVLFIDGSSCRTGGGMGIHLLSPDGQEQYYMVTLAFKVTNNEVEYEALLAGLSVAAQIWAIEVDARSDSQVVVNQVLGVYAAKGEKLKKYLARVWEVRDLFSYFAITQIPRVDNEVADRLARAALGEEEVPLPWPVERRVVEVPAMGVEVGVLGSSTPDWVSSIVEYLDGGKLSKAREEARKIKKRAARFPLIDGILYKRGFSVPLLRCISAQEAQYVLAEIHEGIYGNYSGGRTLARKAVRASYYWPNALRDTREFAKRCAKCQTYAPIPHAPPEELASVTTPWSFTQWGVNLVGPFQPGKCGVKFMIVVDYFTKWAETEPLATITGKAVKKFLWKNVVYRFGIPHSSVTDNGHQFDSDHYREWMLELMHAEEINKPAAKKLTRTDITHSESRSNAAHASFLWKAGTHRIYHAGRSTLQEKNGRHRGLFGFSFCIEAR